MLCWSYEWVSYERAPAVSNILLEACRAKAAKSGRSKYFAQPPTHGPDVTSATPRSLPQASEFSFGMPHHLSSECIQPALSSQSTRRLSCAVHKIIAGSESAIGLCFMPVPGIAQSVLGIPPLAATAIRCPSIVTVAVMWHAIMEGMHSHLLCGEWPSIQNSIQHFSYAMV